MNNDNISEEQLDLFGKRIVKHIVEDKLRTKYEHVLSDNYNVYRSKERFWNFTFLSKIAAIIVFTGSCLFVMNSYNNKKSSVEIAINLLDKTKLIGYQDVLRKGPSENDKLKKIANMAYVKGDYNDAIIAFNLINKNHSSDDLDKLYLAICYLFVTDYSKAIPLLNECKKGRLSEEASWYLALAYTMEDENEGQQLLKRIVNTKSYQYKNARLLLENAKD